MPTDLMFCAPAPCGSCPYRQDTPPGVWDASEYRKLTEFAESRDSQDGVPNLNVFLCHQTNVLGRKTVCRGWLTVEQDSLAVRLALLRGQVSPAQVYARSAVDLYATGEEAAAAGLRGILEPSRKARRLAARLLRNGAGKNG